MIQHFVFDKKYRVRFILECVIDLQSPSLSGTRNFNSYFDVQLTVAHPIKQASHPENNLKNEYTLLFYTICESIKLKLHRYTYVCSKLRSSSLPNM